ncbi:MULTISPECIES: IS3 family transposase [Corynebacterium]|uniref:IS3 family transposase n=1 Tax=Corynebacterium TaxID=1716 RepID=UPI0023B7F496|nr:MULTISPECIES: IS3 family transposase [Corynebacterium]MDN8624226.1 IS3 family transposase [Corynebacterium kroppenstedtii]
MQRETPDALRTQLPLAMLLDVAGLAPSSFYYQLQASRRPDKYAGLRRTVAEHALTYEYRRLKYSLARDGVVVSEKVIRRITKEDGILVRYKRTKARYSSYKGEIAPAAHDLVKRIFHADYPGRLWLTDVTDMAADDGKVYLSALIDCFDSSVVGWAVGFNPNQQLVDASLRHALTTNPPDDPSQLVIHSDPGCQYRSRNWCNAATTVGFHKPMSRRGCSPDNAACEAFFGRMTVEMFHDYHWHRKTELAATVEDYLKFYNTEHITNTLGGLTTEEHHRMMTA